MLADDVEVVVVAYNLSVDESSRRHIFSFITKSEESFAVSEVDHDDCDFHLAAVTFIHINFKFSDEVLDNKVDLVSGNGQHENYKFLGWTLISFNVSVEAL